MGCEVERKKQAVKKSSNSVMCAAQKSCVVNGHSNLNMCSLGIYCTELEDIPCGHLVNAKRKKELHPSFTFHFIHTSAHFVSSLLCDTPRESRSG